MEPNMITDNSFLVRDNSLAFFSVTDTKQIYEFNDVYNTDIFWENSLNEREKTQSNSSKEHSNEQTNSNHI